MFGTEVAPFLYQKQDTDIWQDTISDSMYRQNMFIILELFLPKAYVIEIDC